MSSSLNIVEVTYRCRHLSCRNPKCYQATLKLDKDQYDRLFETEREPNVMRSPTNYCKLGTPQQFEVLAQSHVGDMGLTAKQRLEDLKKKLQTKKSELHAVQGDFEKKQAALRVETSALESEIKYLNGVLTAENSIQQTSKDLAEKITREIK